MDAARIDRASAMATRCCGDPVALFCLAATLPGDACVAFAAFYALVNLCMESADARARALRAGGLQVVC